MCTVTWVKTFDNIVVTSNRDEHIGRPAAHFPHVVQQKNQQLLFPKDGLAGGTWFAISDLGRIAVLLNGAFEKHIRKPTYNRSRGLILLDILMHEVPLEIFQTMDFSEVEPFTLIYYEGKAVNELRWDAGQKYTKELDPEEHHIWSSSTLYEADIRQKRDALFHEFVLTENSMNENALLGFHQFNHGDFENGFVIDRNTGLKTVSITQTVISENEINMRYHDLLGNSINSSQIPIRKLALSITV
ncbi:MAG: NRDE family protein [Flavobacteriales bacterium]